MANIVKLKRSSVADKVPSTADLQLGELALNTYDGNLFFKKSVSSNESIVTVATVAGVQTLTNKSLTSPTIYGNLNVNGHTGTAGQILISTGTSVQWGNQTGGSLANLSDVSLTSPTANQVLTYTGSAWINSDPNVIVASAVFATNAQTDMGSVEDLVIGIQEDLGFITDIAIQIYNMGQLKIDGIVSLSNIDQSVKADYIAYSIIFGF
jgi:hypothetical protein